MGSDIRAKTERKATALPIPRTTSQRQGTWGSPVLSQQCESQLDGLKIGPLHDQPLDRQAEQPVEGQPVSGMRALADHKPTPSESMRFGLVVFPLGLLPPPGVAAQARADATKDGNPPVATTPERVTPVALDPVVRRRRPWEGNETRTAASL
jgi:hypothetical protein